MGSGQSFYMPKRKTEGLKKSKEDRAWMHRNIKQEHKLQLLFTFLQSVNLWNFFLVS